MNKSGEIFLSQHLKISATGSVQVKPSALDSAPDIVILNDEGYMYEVKNKKIGNSLNLRGERANKIACAYLVENEELVIFYLVLTNFQKLFVVKRHSLRLQVINIYENVSRFEVYDFTSLGYPQLEIHSQKRFIVKFPVDDTKAGVNESECETSVNLTVSPLMEKLQIISRHADELTEECYSLKKLCQTQDNTQEDFSLLPIDSVKFSLPLEKNAEEINIIATWIKVIGVKILFGIKIVNNGKKELSDLEFKLTGNDINQYSYRFFSLDDDSMILSKSNPLFSCKEISPSVQPGQKITVVGAVSRESFLFSYLKILQVSCYLTSAKFKNYLVSTTFDINVFDIKKLDSSSSKILSVEDLQAIKTAKSETKLKIETKNSTTRCLQEVLVNDLGFVKIRHVTGSLFYCDSIFLNGVFIAVNTVAIDEPVWKIMLYTSDEAEVCFLVNALYEFLPEDTTVLLDED